MNYGVKIYGTSSSKIANDIQKQDERAQVMIPLVKQNNVY